MPRVLDDLDIYIKANSSGLFITKGRVHDTPTTCIALLEILGFEPPNETFGASNTFNWERPQIQVISRAGEHDYELARTNAETVYKILRNVYNTSTGINGTKYHLIKIRSSPHYDGEDDNSRHLITFTIDIWKDTSS